MANKSNQVAAVPSKETQTKKIISLLHRSINNELTANNGHFSDNYSFFYVS
jgi:hypothetical protein